MNHYKINNPINGLIPFDLYPYQRQVLNRIKNNTNNIIVAARQSGISTLMQANALDDMHNGQSTLILVRKQVCIETHRVISEYPLQFSKNRIGDFVSNIHIQFDTINAVSEDRLLEYDRIVMEDVQYMSDSKVRGVIEHLEDNHDSDRKITMYSAAGKHKGYFYELYKESPDFKKTTIRSFILPRFSKEWKDHSVKQMGLDRYRNEYECRFG